MNVRMRLIVEEQIGFICTFLRYLPVPSLKKQSLYVFHLSGFGGCLGGVESQFPKALANQPSGHQTFSPIMEPLLALQAAEG